MYRLTLLGGVALTSPEGPVEGRATQQRRLALLALIGSAGERGRSRDQLSALLWPEADGRDARQNLSHSIYALRKSLGDDAVRSAGEYVRLSRSRVEVDSVAFEQAVAAGEGETAVRLYKGPFMDGFFVDGAPEFERWMDGERRRLSTLYLELAERSAAEASNRGDHRTAAGWWQRLISQDPYDSAAVVKLMDALSDAGDPANAIQVAQDHLLLLQEEFGLGPPEDIVKRIEELRSSAPEFDAASIAVRRRRAVDESGDIDPSGTPVTRLGGARHPARSNTAITALATLVVAAVLWTLVRGSREAIDYLPNAVVVHEIENLTGDSTLDPYGRYARYLLLAGLTDIDTLRVVEAENPTASEAGSVRLAASDRLPRLARGKRPGLAVESSYLLDSDSLVFEARILDSSRGIVLDGILAAGGAGDPLRGVRELRDRVLTAVATHLKLGEDYNPSYGRGQSFQAWQEVDAARALWVQGGREREAFSLLKRALEIDSTFDAALGLAMIWHLNFGEVTEADSIARLLDERILVLSPRQRWQLAVDKAVFRRDPVGAYDAFQDWRKRLATPSSYYHESIGERLTRQYRECVRTLDQIDPADERYGRGRLRWMQYASCHHALGEYRAAARKSREGLRMTPGDLVLLYEEARAEAALGRPDAALALANEVGRTDRRPREGETFAHDDRFMVLVDLGLELAAHGHPEAAAEALNVGVEWYRTTSRLTGAASDRWRLARALYAAGRWEEAATEFGGLTVEELEADELLFRHNIDVSLLGYRAVLAVRLGEMDEADQLDQELLGLERPLLWGHAAYWRAAIAAVREERETAVLRLAEAMRLGLFPFQWGAEYPKWDFHIDPDFADLRDDPSFRELVAPRG